MIDFSSKEWKEANPKISLLLTALDNLQKYDELHDDNYLDFNQDWQEENNGREYLNDEEFLTDLLRMETEKEFFRIIR